jgi:peptidoglycan/LPS O-acetylase OafA/YrhL
VSTIKHIPVLNSLRAIAAMSVCLFHFVCTVTGFVSNEVILQIFSYGHYGVQMFFVISGFVIPWSMFYNKYKINNFFTFTAKRLIRLEPPYIISLLFAILHTYIRALSPHYNGVDITPTFKQILLHFGYLIPFFEGEKWIRPVYWTLAIEFQYYIAIGLLYNLIWSNKLIQRILLYSLFLCAPLLLRSNFLPYHLPIFLLGIILCLYKTNIIKMPELLIISIAAFIAIAVFHDWPTVIFSGSTFFLILYGENIKSKIGDFLGNISYSIYLFHSLTGMIILNYFTHTVTSPVIKFVLLILAIMVSIACSVFIYKFIEKPSKELSSRVSYKRKQE